MDFVAETHTHSYKSVVTKPTCTALGYTTKTCTCGDVVKTEYIASLGHITVIDEAKVPTCGESGLTVGAHCLTCGESLVAQKEVPATGAHTWDSGKVTLEPTENTEGVLTRTCSVCGETKTESIPVLEPAPGVNPFTDVTEDSYCYDAVLWAVESEITTGTGEDTFHPDAKCTRAQVVTFLWRAAGSPEAALSKNPFDDVRVEDYFYKAVLWAVENGITTGISETTFGADGPCTRAQVATFLWRANGKPELTSASNPFADVTSADYYYIPVLWALKEGITTGTTGTTFSPENPCTRGQIVTFLYRSFAE